MHLFCGMKTLFPLLSFMLFAFLASAADNPPEKFLISYTHITRFDRDTFIEPLRKNHVPAYLAPIRYKLDVYEIEYWGLWIDSTYTKAKGLCFVPVTEKPMPEMVYCHGTRMKDDLHADIGDDEQMAVVLFAADGYFGMYPYYYGFGGSDKPHLYTESFTEASSVAYMIKAAHELQQALNIKTTGQLFITGYSQGGHSAMATHKFIQENPNLGLTVTASSPMSGPYDLAKTQTFMLYKPYKHPHYLPYMLMSYQAAYNIWPGDGYEIFKEAYADSMRRMFALPRKYSYREIDAVLPSIPKDVIQDSLMAMFTGDTTFALTKYLRSNSNWNWIPKAPMQLCACTGDNQVTYKNSELAYNYMRTNGATVTFRKFGSHLNHFTCAPFTIMYAKLFFDRFRDGKKNIRTVNLPKNLLLKAGVMIIQNRAAKKARQAKRHQLALGDDE